MSSTAIFFIAFATTFGGAFIGSVIAPLLPKHHLSDASKDVIKLGAGVIATLTALVLGLLLGAAKSSFDGMNTLVVQSAAKIITIDGALRQYGPEANELRIFFRQSLSDSIREIWPDHQVSNSGLQALESTNVEDAFLNRARNLKPTIDSQRSLHSQILQLAQELVQNHWLLVEENLSEMPTVLLVILLCWMAILYTTYGLFTPRNATVLAVLFVCAFSVSSAVFLINELSRPFDGIIQISSAPMLNALQHLAR